MQGWATVNKLKIMNTELMFSSISNEWETPKDLFDKLNDEFDFTLDPCCTDENRTCENYFTIKDDGLNKDWQGHNVYLIRLMVEKLASGLKSVMKKAGKEIYV